MNGPPPLSQGVTSKPTSSPRSRAFSSISMHAPACPPVLLARRVQVGDDQRHARALGDLDRLGDRLLQVPAVVPYVGVVGPAVRRERLRHLDDLVRVREDGVLVHQAGADTRARRRRARRPPGRASCVRSSGLGPDGSPRRSARCRTFRCPVHRHDVDRRPGLPPGVAVLAHRLPRPVVAVDLVDGRSGPVVVDHVRPSRGLRRGRSCRRRASSCPAGCKTGPAGRPGP